jgi:phospholipid/cholesterol/gamma-HCH transport system ATP-binding protein
MSMSADSIISVRNLTMRFGSKLVHEDLNLVVRRGEVLAVVGGSGCGKTTLLRQMALLQQPSAGTVEILGYEVSDLSGMRAQKVRQHIGVLFQNGALFGGLTVLENVGLPLREHTDLSDRLIDEIAALKLSLVRLQAEDGYLYPNQLSGGMRKRVALARAIALDPEVLFLDEPTSGLDPVSADAFDELVLDLKQALDPTVVLVSHDIDTLWRVADRVVLLDDGHIVADGSMAELAGSDEPRVVRFLQGPRGRAAQAAQ